MFVRVLIFRSLLIIAIGIVIYTIAGLTYVTPLEKKISVALTTGATNVDRIYLKDVTPFEWDKICSQFQVDDSFDVGSISDYLKQNKLESQWLRDKRIIELPWPLFDHPFTVALFFFKGDQLIQIARLRSSEDVEYSSTLFSCGFPENTIFQKMNDPQQLHLQLLHLTNQ